MKLPKGFGGGMDMGSMLKNMESAMARAKNLDAELAAESIVVAKGPVTMVVNGLGEVQSVKIDPSAVDPGDVEMLEDLIVSAARDGFQQAKAMHTAKVQEILPNVPDIPGLT